MLLLSRAQRPAPPSGKYFKVFFEPLDCVEVDFLPVEEPLVSLFLDCGHTETSDDIYVAEIRPHSYQVEAKSAAAYGEFILLVQAHYPYDTKNGDLHTFYYDCRSNTVTVIFRRKPNNSTPWTLSEQLSAKLGYMDNP
ncbi:hypothetical protein FOZ63_010308 [Perkinsus olseni]|nr:hypothetical protein FOZ63_010308 [Perkinsus olseni]KAF4746430.1 hypothetical protein FOZ62_003249 [Perkinsus olseni]